MTLQECIDFCYKHKDKMWQQTSKGSTIKAIIPAPNSEEAFTEYIKQYLLSGNVMQAAVMCGSKEYEPLLIFNSDESYFLYSWYSAEYPEDLQAQ